MIDREKLHEKLSFLRDNLIKLGQLSTLPKPEFIRDYRTAYSARYLLQTSIEAIVDSANHIIARSGWKTPKSYRESFEILAANGVIPEESLPTYSAMAGFRNRVVHLYTTIDDAEVFEILQNNLKDLESFAGMVAQRFLLPQE